MSANRNTTLELSSDVPTKDFHRFSPINPLLRHVEYQLPHNGINNEYFGPPTRISNRIPAMKSPIHDDMTDLEAEYYE